MSDHIEILTKKVQEHNKPILDIINQISQVILGGTDLASSLTKAFLSSGHVLLEGLPGLAKTLLAETYSTLLGLSFKRVQFTPDLLPTDLTGGEIYNAQTGNFTTRKGPLFTNLLLADEINRAPAKVQSALLEAMAEKKITIGLETFPLEEPYMVIATQNPIEQEGTYPLPEAQMDRFMLKVLVGYPDKASEIEMLNVHGGLHKKEIKPQVSYEQIQLAREVCDQIYADDKLKKYIIELIHATRNVSEIDPSLAEYIDCGASPRASLALLRGAKANAFLQGRGFAIPEDVKEIALEVLRHRIHLNYNALAEEIKADLIIKTLIQKVEVP